MNLIERIGSRLSLYGLDNCQQLGHGRADSTRFADRLDCGEDRSCRAA